MQINTAARRPTRAVRSAAHAVAASLNARAAATAEWLEPRRLLAGWAQPADLPPGQHWAGTGIDSLDNLDGEPSIPAELWADANSTDGPSGGGDHAPQPTGEGGDGRASPEGSPFLATVGREFDGIDRTFSGFIPPDTEGAVGDEHVVEMINGGFRIWDKNGNQLESRSLDSFWINRAGVTPAGSFSFDPRIQFDNAANRWYACSVDNAGGDNNFLFAVSLTGDPTGAWAGFRIDSDVGTGNRWADFPMMGFDNAGVYITANMFDIAGGVANPTEVNVLILPKADLLLATPSVAQRTKIEDVIGTLGFAAQPVVYKDSSEFGASYPPVFVSADNDSYNFSALGGTILAPTVVASPDVALANRANPPLARQPDGLGTLLDSGGNRIRSQVVFQNGNYWGVNGVDVNGKPAIRFVKIAAAITLVQDRAVFPAPDEDWIYASIDVNEAEEVAVGFTATGPSKFPSATMVLGNPDGTGQTNFPTFFNLQSGNDDYQALDGSGRNRWGDYSATHFDPQDDSYFWTFQEYSKGVNPAGRTGTWGTHIAEFSHRGVVPGRLPRTLTSAEGAIAPHGPTAQSDDVNDGNSFFDFDFDIDSYYFSADNSLRGTGNVTLSANDLGNVDVDTVIAVYDSATGTLIAVNDDFVGDDSQVTVNVPLTTDRYIVAVGNKLYTPGTGSTSGDVAINVTWENTFAGANIPLDGNGDGSANIILSPATDSDFYRATAPGDATGTAVVTLDPDAALDGDVFVFDAAGALLGRGVLTGLNVNESVNLTGLSPGQEIYITVQSNNFATAGNGVLAVNFATGDIIAPVVTASAFDFQLRQSVSFTFSEPINQATLAVADLQLTNDDTNVVIPTPGPTTVAYNAATRTATFTFNPAGGLAGTLVRGNYEARMPPGSVTDVAGNPLGASGAAKLEFFVTPGDANRDRTVNLADFAILRANFGQSGRTFGQGNFDYDATGNVNLADFAILRSFFGTTLAPPTPDDLFGGGNGGGDDDSGRDFF